MPAPTITGVPTAVTAFVGGAEQGPADAPVSVTSVAAFTQAFGGGLTPLALAVRLFFENGGREAVVVRAGSGVDAGDDEVSEPALQAQRRGVWALERAEAFNLLCVPPYSFDAGGDVSARTRRAAATLCRARRAFFLADALASWSSIDDVLSGPEGIDSDVWGLPREASAALYVPRLVVADPDTGRPVISAPGGAVAGVMARTDLARGVWKAPAGSEATLSGVTGLSPVLTHADQGRLNPAGINVLRHFPDSRPVVWGARTLLGDSTSASEWKYIPVRRLALFLEASMARGTTWAAREPNGEVLWTEIRRAVSTFLHELFRAGAFQGRTDREAYFVKCDAQTTTAADIAAGRANVVVGFAPLKPAEFVVLEVTVEAGATIQG